DSDPDHETAPVHVSSAGWSRRSSPACRPGPDRTDGPCRGSGAPRSRASSPPDARRCRGSRSTRRCGPAAGSIPVASPPPSGGGPYGGGRLRGGGCVARGGLVGASLPGPALGGHKFPPLGRPRSARPPLQLRGIGAKVHRIGPDERAVTVEHAAAVHLVHDDG